MKVRNGGDKEIPLIQGKEQRLCFAGTAVERYPTSKVSGSGREELPCVRGQGLRREEQPEEGWLGGHRRA